MFEGFELRHVEVADSVVLRVRIGGSGPPVVLLHGHPRTHATWHRVAPLLVAAGHTVVCPDLRGYGGSTAPPVRPDHTQASKREMAADVAGLMCQLGHDRYAVVGHDRGSYVARRVALDDADRVTHLVVLDCAPIGHVLAHVDARFAEAWWHWFFFATPEKPERVITADPGAWYGAGPERRAAMGAANYNDWLAAILDPAVVTAMVEDYRAGLGVDRADDDADRAAGNRVRCPVLVGWSAHDDTHVLHGDLVTIWHDWADDVRGGVEFDSGHHVAEGAPEALATAIGDFLAV